MKKPTVIVYLKYFKRTTRAGLPIFYNYPLLTCNLPDSWREFEKVLKKARYVAERTLHHRLGRHVKGRLELFVQKPSPYKDGQFVVLFPRIVVDGFGNVVKVKAPRREHPEAYRLYLDYLREMHVKTGDEKWWYKYLGVSTDPNWPGKSLEYRRRMEEAREQLKPPKLVSLFDPLESWWKPTWLGRALEGRDRWIESQRSWFGKTLWEAEEKPKVEKRKKPGPKRKRDKSSARTYFNRTL